MNEPTDGEVRPDANPVTPESTEVSPPVAPPSAAIPPLLPPLLPVEAPLPPPLPAAWDVPLLKSEKTPVLAIATGVTGVLQFILSFMASGQGSHATNYPYRIGSVLGGTVIWPLIIIGLFSLGRRFRTTRSRMTILLVVWGIFVLGSLGTITAPKRNSPAASGLPKKPAWQPAQINPVTEKFAVPTLPVTRREKSADAGDAPPYDFSRGSDKRLLALIDGAQKERYQAIVAAYTKACARNPDDAVLALERVRFVERFVYSEDLVIEEATADHDAAVQYLKSEFPDAPGTVLYLLDEVGADEQEATAKSYEHLIGEWNPEDRAAFLLFRARAVQKTSQTSALAYVRESFALNATVAAGLLLAEYLPEKSGDEERLKILTDPVFDAAEPWFKKQKLLLLLKMNEANRSVELYAKLKAEASGMVMDAETADGLAKVGRIESAREIFTGLADQKWNQQTINLRRFSFELVHGNREQAVSAYRTMRATGLTADPLLHYRATLFMKHPAAGWNTDDMVGALMLVLTTGGMVLLPLLFLVPAHYWSLLRAKKGKSGGWVDAHWGLRHAWVLLGTMMVLDFAAIWLLEPATVRSWVSDGQTEENTPVPSSVFVAQSVHWIVISFILIWLLWRRPSWRLVGSGQWSFGRCLGIGAGATLIIRMLLGLYGRIWPEMAHGEITAALSQTHQLMKYILETCGPWGLLGIVAVFVPLFEEVLFRGVLLQALGKHIPFGWANLGQALIFALVHENYRLFPFYLGLGLVAGGLTRKSGGLLAGCLLHSFNNALACIVIIYRLRHG